MTQPGLEPGPLDPESSVLTTRPPRLPQKKLQNASERGLVHVKGFRVPAAHSQYPEIHRVPPWVFDLMCILQPGTHYKYMYS